MKSDLPYLGHIADSIAAIESYVTGYWSVDLLLVWDVVTNDLPLLKNEVRRLAAPPSGPRSE